MTALPSTQLPTVPTMGVGSGPNADGLIGFESFNFDHSALLALGGSPGCGKGTMIKHVIRPFCAQHNISLVVFPLSAEIQSFLDGQTAEYAHYVRSLQKEGRLVPDEVANTALNNGVKSALQEHGTRPVLYVIDGSPRTVGQISTALIEAPNTLGVSSERTTLINFVTPPHLCGFRAAGRAREDDKEESFQVRWSEYETKTRPTLEMISANASMINGGVLRIDGSAIRSSPNVFARVVFGRYATKSKV